MEVPYDAKGIIERKNLRLPGYDYSLPNYYAVAICTAERRRLFGTVLDFEMRLSPIGEIANHCLLELPDRFSNVLVDIHVVMPDHIHAILELRGGIQLANVICNYKSKVSYLARKQLNIHDVWQRRYYDHIIRNEKSLHRHRRYIETNPIAFGLKQFEENEWIAFVRQREDTETL